MGRNESGIVTVVYDYIEKQSYESDSLFIIRTKGLRLKRRNLVYRLGGE